MVPGAKGFYFSLFKVMSFSTFFFLFQNIYQFSNIGEHSASSEVLVEMYVPGPHPGPIDFWSPGVGPGNLYFGQVPQVFLMNSQAGRLLQDLQGYNTIGSDSTFLDFIAKSLILSLSFLLA